MIDYETLKETSDETAHDRLTALLIGIIAILAAALVLVQTDASQAETRANAVAARLTAEISSRLAASSELMTFQLGSFQQALQLGIQGTSRQIVALGVGDEGQGAIGAADMNAARRLQAIATQMGAVPDEDSPLDAYARTLLASTIDEMRAMVTVQNGQRDLADEASGHSTAAVLGLSVLALAGVLVGLSAVLGGGRAGTMLLLLAWVAAAGAVALLVVALGGVSLGGVSLSGVPN